MTKRLRWKLLDPDVCAKSGKERYVFDFEDEDKSEESNSDGGQEDYKSDSDEEDFGSQSLKMDRPLQCTECNAAFKRSDHLKRHMNGTDHKSRRARRPYKCKICLSTFTQRKSLKIHGAAKHRKKKWHCKHCESLNEKT